MDRVTTFSSYNSVITNLMTTESRLNQVNQQVSSGKVAADLEGFDGNAEALIAAQTLQIRNAGYIQANQRLSSKLDAQAQSLAQVADGGSNARQAIAAAIASGSADGLMSTLWPALADRSSWAIARFMPLAAMSGRTEKACARW